MPKDRVLCTMPGRLGDIFWALVTVKKLAEKHGTQVDFMTSPAYSHCLPIISQQAYIRGAWSVPTWEVRETAPMTPWQAPVDESDWDFVYHLCYRHWPKKPLAFEIADTYDVSLTEGDLAEPWIQVPPERGPRWLHSPSVELSRDQLYQLYWYEDPCGLVAGFTDEWFELKYGLWRLIGLRGYSGIALAAPCSRWTVEGLTPAWSLEDAARLIAGCEVFLGDLSSLAVLAAAMGKPRVLVEPNPQRHQPIFQHWDQGLVPGTDGKPTFDARHVIAEVEKGLKEKKED